MPTQQDNPHTPARGRRDRAAGEQAAIAHIVRAHLLAGRRVNPHTVAEGVRTMSDAELAEALTLTSDQLADRARGGPR